jgi:hypothetical protein
MIRALCVILAALYLTGCIPFVPFVEQKQQAPASPMELDAHFSADRQPA